MPMLAPRPWLSSRHAKAFGTYSGSLTTCSVVEGVKQWLKLGGRHIDTAHDYGTEGDVGKALKESDEPQSHHFLPFPFIS